MTPARHSTPSGGCRSRRAFVAMWTSIAVSAFVAVLVTGGWSDQARGIEVEEVTGPEVRPMPEVAIPNAEQAQGWNGQEGEHWARH